VSFQDVSSNPNKQMLINGSQREDPEDPEYENGLLAFPEGFRMLAGNPFLRSYTDNTAQQAISYSCLGVDGPETPYFPKQNCPSGLRAQVFFPSCWNGKDLDTTDHKSHMSYPSIYNAGKCPPEFPKRFVSLFYEVVWQVDEFKDDWYGDEQPFVWSMGDNTGYGYHGDFVNGWDVPTLQKAVTECTNDSGQVEDCPVFDLYDDSFTNGCKIPTSMNEQVSGVLEALPGCNPVQDGPSNAVVKTGCGAPTTIGTPENNFVDLTVSKKFEYVGCGTDSISNRGFTGASTSAKDMTNEKCVDFCTSEGFSVAGTEYSDECYCSNSIPTANAPTSGLMGNCFMPCAGDSKEFCGGAGTISLYKKCGATCQNVQYGVNNSTLGSGGSGSSSSTPASILVPSSTKLASSIISHASGVFPTTVKNGSYAFATSSTSSSDYESSPATSVVVVLQTHVVVPIPVDTATASPAKSSSSVLIVPVAPSASSPAESSSPPFIKGSDSGDCPIHTVTLAVLTVTVTADYGAMPSHSASKSPVIHNSHGSHPESISTPADQSSAASPTTTAGSTSSAPYGYSNGTLTMASPGPVGSHHPSGHPAHTPSGQLAHSHIHSQHHSSAVANATVHVATVTPLPVSVETSSSPTPTILSSSSPTALIGVAPEATEAMVASDEVGPGSEATSTSVSSSAITAPTSSIPISIVPEPTVALVAADEVGPGSEATSAPVSSSTTSTSTTVTPDATIPLLAADEVGPGSESTSTAVV
jgi:hypothetical protein